MEILIVNFKSSNFSNSIIRLINIHFGRLILYIKKIKIKVFDSQTKNCFNISEINIFLTWKHFSTLH